MTELLVFFNSSLFIALTTIIVGAFAFLLYLQQKGDHKRDAASLILQEIRYAEKLIRNSSGNEYRFSLSFKLLPTNSWNDNVHLFINDLEQTELDLISGFYSQATYLDFLINKISDYKNSTHKPQIVVGLPQAISVQPAGALSIPQQVIHFDPMGTTQLLIKNVCEGVEYVYNTATGEKLKKLSKKKLLFFL